jgi:large subunit ribosomal protein L13
MIKTYMQKPAEVKREWHLIDAQNKVLGQIATEIAVKLMGKNKTTFTPNVDGGDHVVVINASQVVVTGPKGNRKKYYYHSHFPGGIREVSFDELQKKKPAEAIEKAVYNMLPKNKLRSDRMARLKVYPTAEHKHQSQLGK